MNKSQPHIWFNYWPMLFAFALPFGGVVLSWIIAFWAIHSFTLIPSRIQKQGWKSVWFAAFIVFFFLTCLSAGYSQNTREGLTAIEVKLSFILLPYLLFLFSYPKETFYKTILTYTLGLIVNLKVLLIIGTFSFIQTGHFPYYMTFSYFLHPSYLSMYLCFGVLLLLLLPPDKLLYLGKHRLLFWVLILFLVMGILLCASKMGMLIAFLVIPLALLWRMRNFFTLKKALVLIIGVIVLVFFFSRLFPESLNRLYSVGNVDIERIDKNSTESTEIRLLIWRECQHLLPEAGFMGFGVGDVNERLYRQYEQNGLSGAFEHKLNAHNQYFQTFLGLGYPGIIILSFLTLGIFIFGCLKKNGLIALTGIVCVLNFCVESMLQTSAGNLGFVFVVCLIMAAYERKISF